MKITSGDLFIKTWFRKRKSSAKNFLFRFRNLPVAKYLLAHNISHTSFSEKINIFTFKIILKFITKIIIIKYYDEIKNKI